MMIAQSDILLEPIVIPSQFLDRNIQADLFFPAGVDPGNAHLLLINDGQNMKELGLSSILSALRENYPVNIICAAIHAGADRKMEYGVSGMPDFKGRGAKAEAYSSFVLNELLPVLYKQFGVSGFSKKSFAGFSLGGLMALDIVWSNPGVFSTAGVFSGSLWWRSLDQNDENYSDNEHRIMHQRIRRQGYKEGLRFFFQCGNMDETRDRNNNGIIDSIDDTQDLIRELEAKGYKKGNDIYYLELPDGKHDIATWSRAMPVFLYWMLQIQHPVSSI